MHQLRGFVALLLAMLLIAPPPGFAANHREAPITALDRAADITDWFAFVSYDDPSKVTLIMNVDPLLEPGNGPNYFPFDPDIVYSMKIDNNHDAVADVTFEFRFQTEIRAPNLFTGFAGVGNGLPAPSNAPPPAPGTAGQLVVPPAITALDGAGAAGLSLRQTYSVTMIRNRGQGQSEDRTNIGSNRRLFAVPSNVGPRTMPSYAALARSGIYSLGSGVRVFAGTVDDPFYIDLGGAFDTLNLRGAFQPPGTTAGVLTMAQNTAAANIAPDSVAGYNVNTIAIEVPVTMLTSDGQRYGPGNARAVLGTWATTSRPRTTIRRGPGDMGGGPEGSNAEFRQIQRMGHPLVNELLIGTGSKDRFSMSEPSGDSQFATFVLDPVLARVMNAALGIAVPAPPRNDLLPLVQYRPPIAPAGTPMGPVADMLRLNTGVPPTASAGRSRLGVLGGDLAGWPNGRRVSDDVTDIALRAVAGILAGGPFGQEPYTLLGDGVNVNDVAYQETFPYVGFAQPGTRVLNPADAPARFPPGSIECVNNPLQCSGQ